MLEIAFIGPRPGPGWHVQGWTTKRIWLVSSDRLTRALLRKRRWLHVASGRTRHDRPVWDVPGHAYGLDVVVTVVACWLLGARGLHATDWPWARSRPARRTVQRWVAALAPAADDWLHTTRANLIDYVAPRPLEAFLPTGGIPPPEGRTRCSGHVLACKLLDVVWTLENVARALRISLRQLLVVARWRWPENTRSNADS